MSGLPLTSTILTRPRWSTCDSRGADLGRQDFGCKHGGAGKIPPAHVERRPFCHHKQITPLATLGIAKCADGHLHVGTPLALDSVPAFLPAGLCAATLVLRTALEDRTLRAELDGYAEYARRVRWRLIPWLW